MKVTKHYENEHVVLYVEEGDFNTCITLDSEQMMRRLGECLVDLHRTGGRQVEFGGSFVPAISQDMAASERVNDEIHDIFLSAKELRKEYEKLIEGKDNPVLSIRIEDCDLSVRARNVCKHVGIETLGDLTKLCKTDVFKTRMVGKGTIGEFDDLLSKYGLTWAKWEGI